MDEHNNIAKTLLDAGSTAALPVTSHGGTPYVTVPDDYDVHGLEYLLPAPARKRGVIEITEADSFIFYLTKHGSLDECVIYAQDQAESGILNLIAVINDHKSDAPQWRDHRCLFTPAPSVEWKRWTSKDRGHFSQIEFATWLEDNLSDIANVEGMPSGSAILQMALAFEANADKRLRSRLSLQNGGTQFEFVDDEDKDTRTRMTVFERFTLGIPVFDGGEQPASAYTLEARLKYREKDGKVVFWYELIRPDRVFKAAVGETLEYIKSKTGFHVVFGTPGT